MINKRHMEINKPSELTQTVFFKDNDKNALATLTATQMDMFNLIFYKSKEFFIKNNVELTEFIPFEMDLIAFAKEFGKYKAGDYGDLIKQLDGLSNVKVKINALGKNKDWPIETTFTRFIHKIKISRHRKKNKKKVRLVLDGEICQMVFEVKKLFTKFFLTIQFSMHSKYSKLLYEILKDYQKIKTKTIDFDLLLGLLNVNYENTNNGQWGMFNQNILKKAVAEINEKSDIKVSYEPIKEKIEGQRKQVTKIKFFIKNQPESRMKELGLIEELVTTHKLYKKSKSKLDKLVSGGYKVVDEEMWIETDIRKNEEMYESENRIDKWLKSTEKNDRTSIYEVIAESLDDCEDPIVTIENYKVVGVFSNEGFTSNATETINLLNKKIKELVKNEE